MLIQLLFPLVLIGAAAVLIRGVVLGRQPGEPRLPNALERVALWAAFLFSLVPSLLLLVVPAYTGVKEVVSASGGPPTVTAIDGTLLQANGLWALVPLFLPVVLTAAGLATRLSARRRPVIGAAAALLTVFVFLGAFTIGLFYLPAAAALWVATAISSSK